MVEVVPTSAARLGVVLVALFGMGAAVGIARPGWAASSNADAVAARFTADFISTSLGPVAAVEGSVSTINGKPPTYSKSTSLGKLNKSLDIATGTALMPAVTASGATLKSTASGSRGIDTNSAQASSTAKSMTVALIVETAPGILVPVPLPFLTVTVSDLSASAGFNQVFPSPAHTSGAVSFGALTVTGSLLTGTIKPVKGAVKANTVLYQSKDGALSITLNRQIPAGLVSCQVGTGCTFTPNSITTDAVAITLRNASLQGHQVTGEIVLGHARAGQ